MQNSFYPCLSFYGKLLKYCREIQEAVNVGFCIHYALQVHENFNEIDLRRYTQNWKMNLWCQNEKSWCHFPINLILSLKHEAISLQNYCTLEKMNLNIYQNKSSHVVLCYYIVAIFPKEFFQGKLMNYKFCSPLPSPNLCPSQLSSKVVF